MCKSSSCPNGIPGTGQSFSRSYPTSIPGAKPKLTIHELDNVESFHAVMMSPEMAAKYLRYKTPKTGCFRGLHSFASIMVDEAHKRNENFRVEGKDVNCSFSVVSLTFSCLSSLVFSARVSRSKPKTASNPLHCHTICRCFAGKWCIQTAQAHLQRHVATLSH